MIQYAYYPFQFGYLKIGYTEEHVVYLKTVDKIDCENINSALSDATFQQVEEYLSGKRKQFDVPILASGTEFQQKAWQALLTIPYGETRTYKDMAVQIGNEKACRAIGLANNKNPIHIIIPCHRVIGSNGSLTGYAGGLDMKQYLLKLEHKA